MYLNVRALILHILKKFHIYMQQAPEKSRNNGQTQAEVQVQTSKPKNVLNNHEEGFSS